MGFSSLHIQCIRFSLFLDSSTVLSQGNVQCLCVTHTEAESFKSQLPIISWFCMKETSQLTENYSLL